jgi:beta-glucosidase
MDRDTFCVRMNVSCATVADDFYHTYGTDIALMRDMSLGAFRMSLSWSRLMTWNGTRMVANQVSLIHCMLGANLACPPQRACVTRMCLT